MITPSTSIASAVLTLTKKDAATLIGISKAQFHKLESSGRIGPMPVALGTRCPRYRTEELRDWLAAGAPDRLTWQKQRTGK